MNTKHQAYTLLRNPSPVQEAPDLLSLISGKFGAQHSVVEAPLGHRIICVGFNSPEE
jgi:hypothetical protein